MISSCKIISGKFYDIKRKDKQEAIITKNENSIDIVYLRNDTQEEFEKNLNEVCGNSSFFYNLKKRFSSTAFSVISVLVILFALISSSLYEDLLKKIIFEYPFVWELGDSISILFVILFFFGLVMMPSILDGESSQFKDVLQSWFNKDARVLKRLSLGFKNIDKKCVINIYNMDLEDENHWLYKLVLKAITKRFVELNIYVRNDQKKSLARKLKGFGILSCEFENEKVISNKNRVDILLSSKELILYKLMQLSSTTIINKEQEEKFVSLELFEYCGRNFFEDKQSTKTELISGFQNFINRSFDDFNFLTQYQSNQILFTKNVVFKDLEDERRRLSYFLRNHIEECVEYFDNPISLLVLYYYVKDIVLDEKRTILILEKLVESIKNKQQYDLINMFWFEIAGVMFESSKFENFEKTNNSIYRKLSIKSLDTLMFIFERSGHFNEALKIAKYLYEVNPSKYSIDICSLYERMGEFDKAYNSLDDTNIKNKEQKPSNTKIRHFQRKAWIIVSQRREKQLQEGLEAIEKLNELLFSHNQNNEPLWLWHYYNIKANYAEWQEDYEEAIKNYMKCLSIPALGAFEYGATFVNMAIAYRFKYLCSSSKNQDVINESIRIGKIGQLLKQSVGDRDEMPVVLHNQALNILSKMLYNNTDEKQCHEIIATTNEAIEILDNTNSIKRLGMLLIENIIANSLLKKENKALINRLEKHINKLDNNELTQVLKLYNEFKDKNKILVINYMEVFNKN